MITSEEPSEVPTETASEPPSGCTVEKGLEVKSSTIAGRKDTGARRTKGG